MLILVTEPLHLTDDILARLRSIGEVILYHDNTENWMKRMDECDVLMVRLQRYIGPELMDAASRLKFIVSATTGLDHIDLGAAKQRNIRVISLRDCRTEIKDISATAEHAWGLLLALVRFTPRATHAVLGGHWTRDEFWGTQLRGKRLGIIGFGRIGEMVAQYGHAFRMEVLGCDIDISKVRPPARPVTIDELASACDVISIHVDSRPENRQVVSRAVIQNFKSDAFVINTARGSILDEAALAEAIAAGRVAGAAVDVLQGEDWNDIGANPLLRCAREGHNVLITPHIGGATREAIAQAERFVIDALLAELKNDPKRPPS